MQYFAFIFLNLHGQSSSSEHLETRRLAQKTIVPNALNYISTADIWGLVSLI